MIDKLIQLLLLKITANYPRNYPLNCLQGASRGSISPVRK